MSKSTEIILKLISEYGITKAQLERECGLANGTIRNWENGRNKPSYGAIVKISKHFNVSEEYILGTSEKTAPTEQSLTDKQGQVLSLAKNLSDEDMQKLIDYAELLTKAKNQ